MNTKSFEQTLIDRTPLLHTIALKLTRNTADAEDLVQETILLALRHREKFDQGSRLEAWLYTILRNSYINRYRKQKNRRIADREMAFRQPDWQHSVPADGLTRMLLKSIRQSISQLPRSFGQPLQLCLAGYRYNEIAEITGEPLGTVKSRIHSAKTMLKKRLQNVAD